jgi:hypothetical protein
VLALLAFGASAVPVFGSDNGSVTAHVAVQAAPAACITVLGTTVDFGTRPFNPAGSSTSAQASPIIVTGCATGGMNLLARGTNATSATASWTLTADSMCPATPVVDQYNLRLFNTNLTTSDSMVLPMMGPNEQVSLPPAITMPCVGSSGAGQTMSMSYVFTATIE